MSLQLGRPQVKNERRFRLTEEDMLRASQAVLPFANSMISTAQVIFSGEPSMTLKVSSKFGSDLAVLQETFFLIILGACVCLNFRYCLYFCSVLNMGALLQCGGF